MSWNNSAGGGGDSWNDGQVNGSTAWNGGENGGDVADGGTKDTDTHGCRHCGEHGHFARQCPTAPSAGGGECFNCGQAGHNKSECTNEKVERPFTGDCRICGVTGHSARNCDQKPAEKCRNCNSEGHFAKDCTAPRTLNWTGVEDLSPEAAWAILKKADDERDLDDFRLALQCYCKALPDTTYHELERAFRQHGFNTYLIAKEKEIFDTQTRINLQGKLGCKYEVGFYFSDKPRREKAKGGWPASAIENLERLQDAGLTSDRGVPKCSRCSELGHTTRDCTEEAGEIERVTVKCVNCDEAGHRVRDCPKVRPDRFACRNCKQPGHNATECTEPRSAEGVECRKCKQMGHFSSECTVPQACRNCGEEGHMSKECEKPKNPATTTCRNCDTLGHFSRDCPLPKDWSKVQCNNCKEYGHTVARCKAPKAEEGDDNGNPPDAPGEEPAPQVGTAPEGEWNGGSGGGAW